MTETPRHSVSVAAAIFDDNGKNVLLIERRDNGHWEPPGGVLELDETIQDGLRREVREETGAEILVGPLTGVYKNMKLGIVALVLRCQLVSPHSDATAEASQVRWKAVEELGNLMLEAYAVRIRDALTAHTNVIIRAHDGAVVLPSEGTARP